MCSSDLEYVRLDMGESSLKQIGAKLAQEDVVGHIRIRNLTWVVQRCLNMVCFDQLEQSCK